MIKKRLVEWALEAIKDYLAENGAELADKLIEWLQSLLNGVGEETFACPKCPDGLEECCGQLQSEYEAIILEG